MRVAAMAGSAPGLPIAPDAAVYHVREPHRIDGR
jgi:hypothetical protein